MSQDEGAERSHEATPQKLLEAREKGELVKSQDMASWASYVGLLFALLFLAGLVADRMADLGGSLIQYADILAAPLRLGGTGQGGAVLAEFLWLTTLILAPAFGLVVAALVVQQAFVFAPTKLAPKLSRISILSNAKNKFGPNGLFEFAKSAVKMLLFGGLMVWFLVRHSDDFVVAAAGDPRAVPAMIPSLLIEFLTFVVLVSGAIAAADYAWQRHSHLVKHRMTRQEVMDEAKKAEGDPHFKAKRRQRGQEIALNKMLQEVPEATVIVVNPTHYAVALKWSPLDPTPPICVAKGVDNIAARIREAATEAGVPIYSDPPTARSLFASVDVGDPIDRVHFTAVATAVRFARDLMEKGQK